MNYCKNCKHKQRRYTSEKPFCLHPDTTIKTISYVYGPLTHYRTCEEARLNQVCGIEGRLFEQLEIKPEIVQTFDKVIASDKPKGWFRRLLVWKL